MWDAKNKCVDIHILGLGGQPVCGKEVRLNVRVPPPRCVLLSAEWGALAGNGGADRPDLTH